MDNFDQDYLTEYRLFFDELYRSFETDNPLPVHIGKYKVAEFEIAGEITCWCLEYLNNRNCPPSLIAPLCRGVLAEMEDCIRKVPESCGYRPEEDDFMTLKLMQMTIQKLYAVCLRYRDNSEVSKLPPPPPVPPSVSSAAIKNGNRTMEDCHIIIHDLHALFGIEGYGVASYYAVFDGHIGFDAALYSCAHIYQYLVESSYYPSNPEAAFREAFLKTEERFINKSNKENLKSGTTAVCILIRHDLGKAYVAWLGDSQAMIVNGRDYIQFVNPHHPEQREEKERIESLGGSVMFWGTWRVNGQLAVSRAIGDIDYKPYVIAEPDITSYDLTGDEDFLLIACDGFWDVICEKNAVEEVYKCLEEHKGDRSRVSQSLVQAAKSLGSRDNITVVVAWLDMSTLENGHFVPETTEVDSADDLLLPPVLRSIKPSANVTAAPPQSIMAAPQRLDENAEKWLKTLPWSYADALRKPAPPKKDDTTLVVLQQPSQPEVVQPKGAELKVEEPPATVQNVIAEDVGRTREDEEEKEDDGKCEALEKEVVEEDNPKGDESGELGGEGESGDDSDEEWNYISGKENREPNQHNKQELTREEMESQLNPNAAEFIPVYGSPSPTDDLTDITRSPRKRSEMKNLDNVLIPSENDFLTEISGRPSDVDGLDLSTTLNGGDITDLSTKAVFGDDDSVVLTSMNSSFVQSDGLKSTNPFASSEVPNFVQDHFSETGDDVSKPVSEVKSDSDFDFLGGDDIKSNVTSEHEHQEQSRENADVSGLCFGDGVSVDDIVRSKQDSPLLRESPEPGLPNGQTAIESSSPDFEKISHTEITPEAATAQNNSITPDVTKEESVLIDQQESQSTMDNLTSENLAHFNYNTEKMLGVGADELEHGPETSVDSDSERSIPIADSNVDEGVCKPGFDEDLELEEKDVFHKDEEDIDFACPIKTSTRGNDEIDLVCPINEVTKVFNDILDDAKIVDDDLVSPMKVDNKVTDDDVVNSMKVGSLVDTDFVCNSNTETKMDDDDLVCPIKPDDKTAAGDDLPNSFDIDNDITHRICICPAKIDTNDYVEVVDKIEKENDDDDTVCPIKGVKETVDEDLVCSFKPDSKTTEDDFVCSFKKGFDEAPPEISSEDIEEDSSFEKLQQIPSDFEIVTSSEILTEKHFEEVPYAEKSKEVISETIVATQTFDSFGGINEEVSQYKINDLTSGPTDDDEVQKDVGESDILNVREMISDSSDIIMQSEISVQNDSNFCLQEEPLSVLEKEEEAEQILSIKEEKGTEEKELISPVENDVPFICLLKKEDNSEFLFEKSTEQEDIAPTEVVCPLRTEQEFTPLPEKEEEKETVEEKPSPIVANDDETAIVMEEHKENQLEDFVCSIRSETNAHENVEIEEEKPLVEQIKSQFIIETEHKPITTDILNSVEESLDIEKPVNETDKKHEEIVDEMSSSMIDHGEDKLLPEPQLNQLDLVQELQFEVQEKTEADTESDSGFEIINASEASTIEMEMRIQSEKEAGAADEKLHLDQNEAELIGKEESPIETPQVEPLVGQHVAPLDLTKVELEENRVLLNGGTVTPPATPPATPAPDVQSDSVENKEGLIAAAVAAAGVATAVAAGTAAVAVADSKKVEEKKKAATPKKAEPPVSKSTATAKTTATKPTAKPTALAKSTATKPAIGASKTTKPPSPATKTASVTSKTTTSSSKPSTPTTKVATKTASKPLTPTGPKPASSTTAAKPKPPVGSSAPVKSTATSSVSAKPPTSTAAKKPSAPVSSVSKPTSTTGRPAAATSASAKPPAKTTTGSTIGAAKPASTNASKPPAAKTSPVKAPIGAAKTTTATRPPSAKSTMASKAPTSTAPKAAAPLKSSTAPLKSAAAPAKPATGTKPPTPVNKAAAAKPAATKTSAPAKSAPTAPLNKRAAAPTAIKKPAAPIEKSVKEANNKLASAKTATVKKTDEKKIISKKDEIREIEVPLTQEPIITTTNGHLTLIENGITGEIVADTN